MVTATMMMVNIRRSLHLCSCRVGKSAAGDGMKSMYGSNKRGLRWGETKCVGRNSGARRYRASSSLGNEASDGMNGGNIAGMGDTTEREEDGKEWKDGTGGGSGPRVCILGGGFGGLYTAVKLEGLMWPRGKKPQVTLVDQGERFSFKPLLYEILTGSATEDEVAPRYSKLLAPYPVSFVQGRVASVEPREPTRDGGSRGGGMVKLESGDVLPYDWLVLALGANTNTFGVPGVKEFALSFSVYDDAMRLKQALDHWGSSSDGSDDSRGGGFPEILIVGGGYAGVELAASLADRFQGASKIRLITSGDDIMGNAPEGQKNAAKKALVDDGVSIGSGLTVKKIVLAGSSLPKDDDDPAMMKSKKLVYVEDGEKKSDVFEADLVIWTAGQVPALHKAGQVVPFPKTDKGAMMTDQTLRVVGNECVFALGDVAVRNDEASSNLPATAQVAFQQADYVAWNIWALINNRPLLRFQYQHLGDMMSLGSRNGAVSLPIPVPPPVSAAIQTGPVGELLKFAGVSVNTTYVGASDGVTVEGPLGALLRRAAYLYRQPTDMQRLNVVGSWGNLAAKQLTAMLAQNKES